MWDFTPHLSGTHSFLSNRATLGGIVSGKLSLSCWQRCVEVAVHAEQQHLEKKKKNKGRRLGWLGVGAVLGEGVGCWRRAMKCTISPGSIVLGFLKGKQGERVLDFEPGVFKIAFCHLGDENPKVRACVRAHTRVSASGVGGDAGDAGGGRVRGRERLLLIPATRFVSSTEGHRCDPTSLAFSPRRPIPTKTNPFTWRG